MSDRDAILARVRAALADVPPDEPAAWEPAWDPDPQASYTRERSLPAAPLTDLFAARCAEYRARVTRCEDEAAAIVTAVAQACARHGAQRLVVPADLDPAWVPDGALSRRDEPALSLRELDGCDGVLTGCALAIALTGTIVLDAGPGQGRRALSLVPDLHICVVRSEQIVGGVPEAFGRLESSLRERQPVTLISGPSATSDIELKRVEGVHGPRRLEVVLAVAAAPATED